MPIGLLLGAAVALALQARQAAADDVINPAIAALDIRYSVLSGGRNSVDAGSDFAPLSQSALTGPESELLRRILYGTATLSVLGSLFIIVTYLAWKRVRTFGTKLIFFLSLSDFLTALCWYPWNGYSDWLCQAQAGMIQFFELASYCWSFTVALSLFFLFYSETATEASLERRMLFFHLVNWGYPAASVAICYAFQAYGRAGAWCWIPDPTDPLRLLVYAPLCVFLALMALLFVAIRIKLSNAPQHMRGRLQIQLNFYLLSFLVSQLPAGVNRLQNFLDPQNPQFWLFVLQAVFQPLQGFFNALVYGTNEAFVEQWKWTFRRFAGARCQACCATYLPHCCSEDVKQRSMRRYDYHEVASGYSTGASVPVFDYDYSSGEEDGKESFNIQS